MITEFGAKDLDGHGRRRHSVWRKKRTVTAGADTVSGGRKDWPVTADGGTVSGGKKD